MESVRAALFPEALLLLHSSSAISLPANSSCHSTHSIGKPSSLPSISMHIEGAHTHFHTQLETRRNLMRNALLTLLGGLSVSVSSAADCKPARAFSLGISGPKEWLKEQKKKTAEFLLAPIIASRDKLNNAYYLLKTGEITFNEDHKEAQRLVKVAARDCIPLERGSLVAFQASTGVEVCTFRLIVKNAASLLDDSDPIKVKAEAAFNDLIRSFAILDELVESGEPGVVRNSEKLGGAFTETFVALDKFETSIKHCLGV